MIYLVLLVGWFLPLLVAWGRGVRTRTCLSIAILAGMLGWTIIGWVFALIWALEAPSA